jgi:uncharacterized protein YjbI with pentapeptide repeats
MRRRVAVLLQNWFLKILVSVFLLFSGALQTQANIYEWAYDSSDNVIQSSTVCPGGSGVSAVPSANLSYLNLTEAYLIGADLSSANLTVAELWSATLTNANLTNANLTNADLTYANLWNANLTNANVAETSFNLSNLTASQLYSTASYKAYNLTDIEFQGNDLTGWNFAGQNLTHAYLYSANLANANLTNANLTNVYLYSANLANANLTNANLTNAYLYSANLTGADLRGSQGSSLGSATATNTILPDGTIQGLHLDSNNPTLLVRNYSNYGSKISIHVLQGMSMNPGTSLVFQFDSAPWGSTISFDSMIPVTLGGNLELGIVSGVDPASMLGNTFQLFNWTGVSSPGQFAQVINDLPTGYSWNTSQLYTTGDVMLVPEPSALILLIIGPISLLASWRRRTK